MHGNFWVGKGKNYPTKLYQTDNSPFFWINFCRIFKAKWAIIYSFNFQQQKTSAKNRFFALLLQPKYLIFTHGSIPFNNFWRNFYSI
jgi:hypothetical protein